MDRQTRHDIVNSVTVIAMIGDRSAPLVAKMADYFLENKIDSVASEIEFDLLKRSIYALNDESQKIIDMIRASKKAEEAKAQSE